MPELRCPRSDARAQMPALRCPRSDTRAQIPELRYPSSDTRRPQHQARFIPGAPLGALGEMLQQIRAEATL